MHAPIAATTTPGPAYLLASLSGGIGTIGVLAICVALVAAGLYVVLWLISRRRRPTLVSILEPYQLAGIGANASPGPAPALTVPILTAPAERLQSSLGGTRLDRWLTDMVERAGWRIRSGELLTIWIVGGVIFLLLGWLLAGLVGFLIVLVLAVVLPLAGIQFAAERRAQKFSSQLPDVLKLTASSLRAGFSLVQGLESVSRQVQEPSKGELQRVLTEARLGRPLDEAMWGAAERIHNRDFTESVLAIRIQQETGGNLAALFDTLAETMVQRIRMRREVRALTAEGRFSAYILGILPVAIGLFIYFVNRAYMMILFNTFAGKCMLVGELLLAVVGFYWMYRTVKIET